MWDDTYIYLIMEYCSGGDLSAFIKTKQALPERTVRVFLRQLGMSIPNYLSKTIFCKKFKKKFIYDARK